MDNVVIEIDGIRYQLVKETLSHDCSKCSLQDRCVVDHSFCSAFDNHNFRRFELAPPSRKHPRWISVNASFPDEHMPVLAALDHHICLLCFYLNCKWFTLRFGAVEEVFGVTHWMPLPSPPEEGGDQ